MLKFSKGAMRVSSIARFFFLLCIIVLLSGCAALGGGGNKPKPKSVTILMQEAKARQDAGDDNAAISLLRQAADQNPVIIAPWVKIAQIRFDAYNYVDALSATREAMKRDQDSQIANSIALVSSLRLAEQSMRRLRSGEQIEGPVRAQAEALARQLRQTLGQDVLVPSGDAVSKRRSGRAHRSSHRRRSVSRHKSAPKQPAATSATSSATRPAAKLGKSAKADESSARQSSGSSANDSSNSSDENNGDGSLNPFQSLQKLPKQ